jgi:alpha-ribazole phosphatase
VKLIFLRHGQTNYNVKALCNSKPNPKVRLTALGRKQAAVAAQLLKKEKIDIIITSLLLRTMQTARIVNRFHHAKFLHDGRLNDRSTGNENKSVSFFYKWREKQKNPWTARPRGGESYQDLKDRLNSFLKDLEKEKYKTVLIVSHLPVLAAAYSHFKKLSNEKTGLWTEKEIPNCKIMRFNLVTKTRKK